MLGLCHRRTSQIGKLIWFGMVIGTTTQVPLQGFAESIPLIALQQGVPIGSAHFPIGDTKNGGHGQRIDGIWATLDMTPSYHVHSHLALIVNGKLIEIPAGIGIISPVVQHNRDFIDKGKSFYWLHTHDGSGIIHVESPVFRQFTLGQFFDIWGEPLTRRNIAGYRGQVNTYVNGRKYTGPLAKIALGPYVEITLEVGKRQVPPPVYSFPPEL